MKFSAREDVEIEIEKVFAAITDFDGFERAAMRRGIKFARTTDSAKIGVGSGWSADFKFRGRARRVLINITGLERPTMVTTSFESGGIAGTGEVELIPLSRTRTRITAAIEMKPQTLAARLMLQSLKIAKTGLANKFKARLTGFANDLEKRLKP